MIAPLHHPNIIELFGVVRAKPMHYILAGMCACGVTLVYIVCVYTDAV